MLNFNLFKKDKFYFSGSNLSKQSLFAGGESSEIIKRDSNSQDEPVAAVVRKMDN